MGRAMDGVQKRRKPSAPKPSILTASTASHGDVEELDWTSLSSMSTSTNQIDPFLNARGNSELDQLAAEPMAPWDEFSREPGSESGSLIRDVDDMDFEDIQSTLLEDDPLLDMNFPQFLPSPSPRSPTQQRRQTHPSSDTSPSTSSSSRFPDTAPPPSPIQTWTILLEQLSRAPNPSPIPLDTLLHTTSTLLPRATHALRSLPTDMSCLTPLILIILCLTQAIALFEQCLPAVVRGLAAASGPRDMALRLGAFQVDREVQAALQRHIVGRELARILHVVQRARRVLRNPGLGGAEKRVHGVVVEDLVRRIKVLGGWWRGREALDM